MKKTASHLRIAVNKPDIDYELVTITPEQARDMLTRNKTNRPLRQEVVNAYARDMTKGWKVTGDPIQFDVQGDLRNGQHRLTACVQTDKPFTTLVVRGLAENTWEVIDSGFRRSPADMLHMFGYSYSTRLAAAAKWLHVMKCGGPNTNAARSMPRSELHTLVKRHTNLIKSVSTHHEDILGARPSLVAALHYVGTYLMDLEDEALSFARVFSAGYTAYKDDAAHALREYVLRHHTRGLRLSPAMSYAATVHAFNLHVARKPLSTWVPLDPEVSVAVDGLNLKKI